MGLMLLLGDYDYTLHSLELLLHKKCKGCHYISFKFYYFNWIGIVEIKLIYLFLLCWLLSLVPATWNWSLRWWKHKEWRWVKTDQFWSEIRNSQFLLDLSQFHFSMLWGTGVVHLELGSAGSGHDRSWSGSTVWGDSLRYGTEEGDGSSQAA